MVPLFIIEDAKRKREQEKRQEELVLRLPLPYQPTLPPRTDPDETDRGAVTIEIL